MINTLSALPAVQMATLVCVAFVATAWVGAVIVRPFFRLFVRSQSDLNSLLGNFVSIYGVFYGILMGLLAVAAYQNKVDVEQAIASEASSLFALFRNVSAYPEPVRLPLQESVRDYVQFAIDGEWPAMRDGEIATGGMPLINRMQSLVTTFEPATAGQSVLHPETTRQFFGFLERRAVRLYSATTGLPGFMWYVVVLGALISIFLVWLFGDIEVDASLPSIGRAVRNVLAQQSVVRPTYKGTGTLYLESSVGGFEVFDLEGSNWILGPGAYWASEADVTLNLFRERVLTSLFTGEGFILLRTKISGSGKVVLKTNGPVEVIELNNERLATDGSYVLGRSEGVSYRVRRSTRSLLGSFLTPERRLRVYEGSGRVLVSSYPYWRQLLHAGNAAKRA